MNYNKTRRSLNTTDILKLCSILFPKRTKNILDKIIICDKKILKLTEKLSMQYKLEIIQEIEKIRAENNSNWMELIRLAFEHAPDEAKVIMSRVHKSDEQITNLFGELSKCLEK